MMQPESRRGAKVYKSSRLLGIAMTASIFMLIMFELAHIVWYSMRILLYYDYVKEKTVWYFVIAVVQVVVSGAVILGGLIGMLSLHSLEKPHAGTIVSTSCHLLCMVIALVIHIAGWIGTPFIAKVNALEFGWIVCGSVAGGIGVVFSLSICIAITRCVVGIKDARQVKVDEAFDAVMEDY